MPPKQRRRRAKAPPARNAIPNTMSVFATPIRNIPNGPPSRNLLVPVHKIVRLTVATPVSTTAIHITGTYVKTFSGFPSSSSSFYLKSITAWAMAGSAVDTASIVMADVRSGRNFEDASSVGQPYAKVGLRFGEQDRITAQSTTGTTSLIEINAAGASLVMDISLVYIDH